MTDTSIILQFAESLLFNMREAVPSVTGKTAKSLELKVDKNGLGFQILGGQQIGAIINGRKPTKNGAKKGNPTLQEQILEWIEIRRIQPKEQTMSQLQLSWAISTSIHKNGTKGQGDIFRSVFNKKLVDSVVEDLASNQVAVIGSQVLKQFAF